MPSRRSISASTSTPASEVRRPPSKAARTALPATGDEKAASARAVPWRAPRRLGIDCIHPGEHARSGGRGGRRGLAARAGLGPVRAGVPRQRRRRRGPARADRRRLDGASASPRSATGASCCRDRRPAGRRGAVRRPAAAETVATPVAHATRGRAAAADGDVRRPRRLDRARACLDPEDMRELLRAYQDAVAGEVARFEGHVAKFMGDGVLAYFGWPKAHEDDAERAVRAGLALVGAVAASARRPVSRSRPGSASPPASSSWATSSARARRGRKRSSARLPTSPPGCRRSPSPAGRHRRADPAPARRPVRARATSAPRR